MMVVASNDLTVTKVYNKSVIKNELTVWFYSISQSYEFFSTCFHSCDALTLNIFKIGRFSRDNLEAAGREPRLLLVMSPLG